MIVLALLAIPRVLAALRTILLNDAQLVAGLATAPAAVGGGPAIYTEGAVPDNAAMPFLTIGPFTEADDSTMGSGRKWGSSLTTPVKLVTTSSDVGVNYATVDRVVALLHGTALAVADYSHCMCLLEVVVDSYQEKFAGIVYRHYPVMFTIKVGQPR